MFGVEMATGMKPATLPTQAQLVGSSVGTGRRPRGDPAVAAARLFLALWPPEPVRAALQAMQAAWHWPEGAALVPPQRLHVTLHFLGQVPLARVGEFAAALDVAFEPHTIDLARARPVLWPGGLAVLQLQAPPELARLHGALGRELRALDWPVEPRAFTPHVTFSRRAWGARPPAEPVSDLPEWQVHEGYALVHSVPSRDYEVLHVYGLH